MPDRNPLSDEAEEAREMPVGRERREGRESARRRDGTGPGAEPEAGAGPLPGPGGTGESESDAERRRRRAQFLRDLNEAKELRQRVQPRRARAARMRQHMRMRTFRW